MGSIFEKICTEYLWERLLQNDLSFSFLDLASWWGKNPQTKKQEGIDIMGTFGHTSVFGECKWKNELVDTPVLDQLIHRSQMFPMWIIIISCLAKQVLPQLVKNGLSN